MIIPRLTELAPVIVEADGPFFANTAPMPPSLEMSEIDRWMPIATETGPIPKSAKFPFEFKSANS